MSMATDDVLAERQRQIDAEGLTEGHDDQHDDKSLALVGACYERHVQTLDPVQTVRALIACCRAWEPDARILGNVRAGDAAEALTCLLPEIHLLGLAAPEAADAESQATDAALPQHRACAGGLLALPTRVLAMCKARGWSMHWTHRGAYLHLEASELIEALRGKRGEPVAEAADVLIVLMSITEHSCIAWEDVVDTAERTVERLENAPRYAGEEYTTSDPPHVTTSAELGMQAKTDSSCVGAFARARPGREYIC